MVSVLASLASPHNSNFLIRLEEPQRVYFPGDEIKGLILVRSSKPVKPPSIRLVFRGRVKTNVRESNVEHLFENPVQFDEIEPEGLLSHQRFHFLTMLPSGSLPSSYLFNGGGITYTFKATQLVPWLPEALCPKCTASIKVVDRIDIRAYPSPVIRPFGTEVKGRKVKKTGNAYVDIDVGKGAVLRGQTIPIRLHITHMTPIKNLEGVLIGFYRITRFLMKDGREEKFPKELVSTSLPILIDPDTLETHINTKITVPKDIPPTISNAKFVTISYFLEIIVDLTIKKTIHESFGRNTGNSHGHSKKRIGKHNGRFEIPIVVGTVENGQSIPAESRRSSLRIGYPFVRGHHITHRHSTDWMYASAPSLDDPFLSPPPPITERHQRATSWNGSVSPVPSAPSLEDLGVYNATPSHDYDESCDYDESYNDSYSYDSSSYYEETHIPAEVQGTPITVDTFSTSSTSSTFNSPSSVTSPLSSFASPLSTKMRKA